MQDGKYDRLLRLLYDDIEKYETEVDIDTLDTEVLSFVKAMHMTESPHQFTAEAEQLHWLDSLSTGILQRCISHAC